MHSGFLESRGNHGAYSWARPDIGRLYWEPLRWHQFPLPNGETRVDADRDDGYTVGDKIEEDWNLSIPGLDHDGYFSYGQLLEAKGLHDQEFIETVFAELDKADPAYRSFQQECTTLPELQEFLFSADGQRALAEYGKKVLSL